MAAQNRVHLEEIWLKFEHKLRAFILSKVHDELVADDLLQELFIKIHSNMDEEFMSQSLEDMANKMSDLPKEYCEALCLTELGNLSQKEYAEKIGISYSGAKLRVQRARIMLKDMLMKCCHYEFDKYGTVIGIYPANCCCCNG